MLQRKRQHRARAAILLLTRRRRHPGPLCGGACCATCRSQQQRSPRPCPIPRASSTLQFMVSHNASRALPPSALPRLHLKNDFGSNTFRLSNLKLNFKARFASNNLASSPPCLLVGCSRALPSQALPLAYCRNTRSRLQPTLTVIRKTSASLMKARNSARSVTDTPPHTSCSVTHLIVLSQLACGHVGHSCCMLQFVFTTGKWYCATIIRAPFLFCFCLKRPAQPEMPPHLCVPTSAARFVVIAIG